MQQGREGFRKRCRQVLGPWSPLPRNNTRICSFAAITEYKVVATPPSGAAVQFSLAPTAIAGQPTKVRCCAGQPGQSGRSNVMQKQRASYLEWRSSQAARRRLIEATT